MFVDAEARKKRYDINFLERDSATWESSLTKVQCAVRQIAVQDTRATGALQHFSASVLSDKDREQLWRLTAVEEEDHWRCCQKQWRAAEQKVEASPCEDRSHYWRAKEAMSEAYTRYVQRIAAVDAFLREQEALEELQLRVVQVQRCATVSRQILVIEAAAEVGNQTLQRLRWDTDANVKTANDVQVRALVRASDKRPQGLQASEPQECNWFGTSGIRQSVLSGSTNNLVDQYQEFGTIANSASNGFPVRRSTTSMCVKGVRSISQRSASTCQGIQVRGQWITRLQRLILLGVPLYWSLALPPGATLVIPQFGRPLLG